LQVSCLHDDALQASAAAQAPGDGDPLCTDRS
jgi:hypothetical protein